MPDISMCINKDCTRRASCYRYTVKPSEYMQSYMNPDQRDCRHYWATKMLDAGSLKEIDKLVTKVKDKHERML